MVKKIEKNTDRKSIKLKNDRNWVQRGPIDKDAREVKKKISMKPSAMLSPVPAVMVSCRDKAGKNNIITIAWTGVMASNPPMVSISVRPTRFSYHMLVETGEFVINIPSVDQLKELDYCGVATGERVDKFKETGLTPMRASKVKAPIVEECPINLECKVAKRMEMGSHTIFIAEVVAVHANGDLMRENGRLALEKAKLVCYVHGHYYAVGRRLGKFGFSVEKKKTAAKRREKMVSRSKDNPTR